MYSRIIEETLKGEGFRINFEKEVETNVQLEGGQNRHDLFFYIHDDDLEQFATWRFGKGVPIRWWEDVIVYNNGADEYSEEILEKYKPTW